MNITRYAIGYIYHFTAPLDETIYIYECIIYLTSIFTFIVHMNKLKYATEGRTYMCDLFRR